MPIPIANSCIRNRAITFFALAAIILFFLITNVIWLGIDITPPAWDPSNHMLICIQYHTFLTQLKYRLDYLSEIFSIYNKYPPLYYFLTLPVVSVLGFSPDHFVYINFFYIAFFVISVYRIGKILFNERVGILSAFFVMLYPLAYGLSRQYYLDFALLTMISWVQYFILKSDGGIKKHWNIALGIMSGLTLLTRTHGIIFFLPTWALVFFMKYRKKSDLKPASLALLITLIIAAPWYIFTTADIFSWSRDIFLNCKGDPVNKNLISSLLFYYLLLTKEVASPPLLIAFWTGLIFLLFIERQYSALLILTFWIIPPYLLLAFWTCKDSRFIMPILPSLAIITIAGINGLNNKFFKNILFALFFCVGLIQFSSVSFSFPYFAKEKTLYYGPPSQADWRIKETLDYISSRTKTSSLLIGILPNLPHFNTCTIALYAKFLKLPYFFYSLGGSNGPTIDRRENLDILIFTNPPFDNCVGREQEIYEEFNIKDASELGFKKIKEFDLPDNHRVIIYENLKKRNKEDR